MPTTTEDTTYKLVLSPDTPEVTPTVRADFAHEFARFFNTENHFSDYDELELRPVAGSVGRWAMVNPDNTIVSTEIDFKIPPLLSRFISEKNRSLYEIEKESKRLINERKVFGEDSPEQKKSDELLNFCQGLRRHFVQSNLMPGSLFQHVGAFGLLGGAAIKLTRFDDTKHLASSSPAKTKTGFYQRLTDDRYLCVESQEFVISDHAAKGVVGREGQVIQPIVGTMSLRCSYIVTAEGKLEEPVVLVTVKEIGLEADRAKVKGFVDSFLKPEEKATAADLMLQNAREYQIEFSRDPALQMVGEYLAWCFSKEFIPGEQTTKQIPYAAFSRVFNRYGKYDLLLKDLFESEREAFRDALPKQYEFLSTAQEGGKEVAEKSSWQVYPALLEQHFETMFSQINPLSEDITPLKLEKSFFSWIASEIVKTLAFYRALFEANPGLMERMKAFFGESFNEHKFYMSLVSTVGLALEERAVHSLTEGLREVLNISSEELVRDPRALAQAAARHPLQRYFSLMTRLSAFGNKLEDEELLPAQYQEAPGGLTQYIIYLLTNANDPSLSGNDISNLDKFRLELFGNAEARTLVFIEQLRSLYEDKKSLYKTLNYDMQILQPMDYLSVIAKVASEDAIGMERSRTDFVQFLNNSYTPEYLKTYVYTMAAVFADTENEPDKKALFKLIPKDRYPMIGDAAETFKKGGRQDFCASAVRVAVKDYLQTKWGIASDLVSFESLPKKLQVRRNIAAAYQILELLKGLEAHPEAYDYVMSRVVRFREESKIYGERLGGLKQSSTFVKSLNFEIPYDKTKAAFIPHDFSATKETADDINTAHVDANKWFSRYFFKKLKNFIARESAAFSLGSLGAATLIMGVLIVVAALAFPPLAIPLLAGVGWAAAFGIGLAIVGGLALFGSFLTGYGTNAKVRIKDKLGEAPQPTVTSKVSGLSTNTQPLVVGDKMDRRLSVTSSNSGSPMLNVPTPPLSPTGATGTKQTTAEQGTTLSEEQRPVSPLGSKQ